MQQKLVYTVSARGKKLKQPINQFLRENYPSLKFDEIDSVFGFVEASTLYSGRPFLERQISDKDYEILLNLGIGLRIPFTNHYCSEAEYEANRPIFEKYHRKGNSIITCNIDLAKWIRRDYPLYQLEASILKEIDNQQDLDEALKLYDTVVLPMNLNYKPEFLKSLEPKDKITLFGNAGCALTCPNRMCYEYLSRQNKKLAVKSKVSRYFHFVYHIGIKDKWCTHRIRPRKLNGIKDFDLDFLNSLGYTRFKMLRENKHRKTGF